MLDTQIPLTRFGDFHHDRSYKIDQCVNTWKIDERRSNILMFGNPDVGRPIAAEHINALPITSRFG